MRQELLWRGGQEAPQVRKERTSDAQQRREGIKHHRRAGHLASNALNAFLTQRPDAPPEARRAPAEIPEAPPSSRAARLDLMAYSQGSLNRKTPPRRRGPPLLRRRRSSARQQRRAGKAPLPLSAMCCSFGDAALSPGSTKTVRRAGTRGGPLYFLLYHFHTTFYTP